MNWYLVILVWRDSAGLPHEEHVPWECDGPPAQAGKECAAEFERNHRHKFTWVRATEIDNPNKEM